MTGREIYKIWATESEIWSKWARPVPFIALKCNPLNLELATSQINYIDGVKADTAIILDLPDSEGIKEGLTLAQLGWRPVPLYNGSDAQTGAMSLIDNKNIQNALIAGAVRLKSLSIPNSAPPVFLTDSNRVLRYKMSVSIFDNSWDLFPQDFPSADCFIKNGINKIIVRGEKIHKDLRFILYKFQKKGIKIYFARNFRQVKEVSVKKPLRDSL